MATIKKALSWQDSSKQLMTQYLKKTKSPAGSLYVLSAYGDLHLQGGKATKIDMTTLGSLAASVAAAGEGLGELMKVKGSPIQFGEAKNIFWFDRLGPDWLLVGIRCPHQAAGLKSLITNLKKGLTQSKKTSEALDGMDIGSIDSQLNAKMGSLK